MGRTTEPQRLRDGGEEGRRQVPSSRDQQLESLVERERIGAIGGEQRTGVGQRRGQRAGTDVPAAAAHLLAIAADGVDLPVVRDRTEGLREAPDRMGVGRVALMEHRVVDVERTIEIGVQLRQSTAGHEALVDDRPGRGGRDGQVRCESTAGGPGGDLQASTGDDQAMLEGLVVERPVVTSTGVTGRSRDDGLDDRRARSRGGCPERGGLERDGPPGRDGQPGLREDPFHEGAARTFRHAAARQEEHDDRRPGPGRRHRARPAHRADQRPDDRRVQGQGNPGSVARLPVRPERAAMR
ncbi:MAG: hypothetical protein WKF78_06325 [Candidatus Limnocylindrales bacterium]